MQLLYYNLCISIQRRTRPICRPLDYRRAIAEPCSKQHVRVGEQALLQRHDYKLGTLETSFE